MSRITAEPAPLRHGEAAPVVAKPSSAFSASAALAGLDPERKRVLRPPITDKRFYVRRRLTRCILDQCEAYRDELEGATLIDYGCGSMPYRPLFERYVSRYVGVDLACNEAAEAKLDEAGRMDLPDASADIVISTQVLEHVDDPRTYLAEAFRVLKPGGLLLLSTHGIWWYHPHPQDLWRWTGEGLHRLLAASGFEPIERRGVMNLAATGVYLFQDGLYGRLPRKGPWRPALFACMQPLAALADRVGVQRRDNMAAVFVTVSRKPG